MSANLSSAAATGAHATIALGLVTYLQVGQPTPIFQAGAGLLTVVTVLHFLYISSKGAAAVAIPVGAQTNAAPLEAVTASVSPIKRVRAPLLLASLVWLGFFLPGVYVPSSQHLDAIQQAWGQGALLSPQTLGHALVFVVCYTFPNVAVLCCATTAIGCCLRSGTCELRPALKYGLSVYFIALSGLFLVGDDPWVVGHSLNYVRLATGMSVLGFVRGFKSSWFA